MKMKFLYFACAFALFFMACNKDDENANSQNSNYTNTADCTGSSPTYTVNVKAIFDAKCATSGCHSGNNAAHGLNLAGYNNAKNNFNNHNTLCAINHGNGCDPMPIGLPKLSDAEIKIITCWAKNNFPE